MSDADSLYNANDISFHLKADDALSIKTSLQRVAVANVWIGVLLTLAVALVLQSTADQRKGAVFFIQCFTFVLAFLYNSLVQFRAIWLYKSKFKMHGEDQKFSRENAAQIACLSLEHWIPLIADSSLVFKLLSFYPLRLYSRRAQCIRLAPTILLLFPRFIIVALLTFVCHSIYNKTTIEDKSATQLVDRTIVKQFVFLSTLDFSFQAVFCFVASCTLLYKTVSFYRSLQQMASQSVKRRLRFFMEATFMTFIPPLVISLACAILVNSEQDQYSDFRALAAALVNASVVFSLLATSWSTVRGRGREERGEQAATRPLINRLYESVVENVIRVGEDIPLTIYNEDNHQGGNSPTNNSSKHLIKKQEIGGETIA